jgi:multiple sugar transport system permease protein
VLDRALTYASALLLAVWVLAPFYRIAISAFTPSAQTFDYPKPLVPGSLSTETIQFYVAAAGILPSLVNSVVVAMLTLAFGLALGAPAGYALARFRFSGRDAVQGIVRMSKLLPVAMLSIPLSITFQQLGLYDSIIGVALVHTAMALPFVIVVTAGVFIAVSSLEEAAETLGCSGWDAFLRVALPLAIPGLVAAAILAFVISWNEVFAASILTLRQRTLPAQVFASLATAPLGFKFAAGLFMVVPAVALVLIIRKHLVHMWEAR